MSYTPSQDQVMGQLRVIIPALGVIVSALGVSGATSHQYVDLALSMVGPISYAIVAAWSLIANSRASIMKSAAKPVDATTPPPKIILPPQEAALADQLPANVTASSVAKIIILGLALSFLLIGTPAMAQTQRVKLPDPLHLIKSDSDTTTASSPTSTGSLDTALANFNTQVQKITKDIVDKAIADVTAAQTDAANHNDQISKPCWDANLTLLKSLPTQWENPPTFPIGLALGIQIQRDMLNSITGNDASSLKVACAALWGDQLRIVAEVAAMLGVKVATGGLL